MTGIASTSLDRSEIDGAPLTGPRARQLGPDGSSPSASPARAGAATTSLHDGYEYQGVSAFITNGGAHIPWEDGWEMVGGALRRPRTAIMLTVQDALSPDNGKTKPLDDVIDEAIEAAVRRHGSISLAADALGISRGTIWDRRRRRAASCDERPSGEDPSGAEGEARQRGPEGGRP